MSIPFAIWSLLLLAAGAGWVRSEFAANEIDARWGHSSGNIRKVMELGGCSGRGVLRLWLGRAWAESSGTFHVQLPIDQAPLRFQSGSARGMRLRRETGWQVLGFDSGSVQSWQQRYGWVRRVIQVPYWLVLLVPLSTLAVLTRRLRRRTRRASGCCVACGYDLRATPQRCPECGTVRSGPLVRTGSGGLNAEVPPAQIAPI